MCRGVFRSCRQASSGQEQAGDGVHGANMTRAGHESRGALAAVVVCCSSSWCARFYRFERDKQ